jgi:hypothetical protein
MAPIDQPIVDLSGAPPSRMRLDAVVRGRQRKPLRILLAGVEGVGKTTFAAGAPAPIFVGAEDGTDHLDVERFPAVETWREVLDAIHVLTWQAHPYKTLVLDTVDWAEPLLWKFVAERDGEASIESYGYGKGYAVALAEWQFFTQRLDQLRRAKEMHIILLAHSAIRTFKNPLGDDYDRYELKLHLKAAAWLKEWCDCSLFANFETFTEKDDKKRIRGLDTGARLIHTERRAAWDAKNRYGLPESLPLSWQKFYAAVQAQRPGDPKVLRAAIEAGVAELPDDKKAKATAALERAGDDAVKLAQLNDWVDGAIAAYRNEPNGGAS